MRSGKKIEVNRYEQIKLPDGRKVRISKVSPFNKLLQHRFVPREDAIYKVPELPLEAHQNWPKWFFMYVDVKKLSPPDPEFDIYYVGGHDSNDRFVLFKMLKDLKDIDVKIFRSGERFLPMVGPMFYKSEIFISDNYDTSLAVTCNYRRCPFCSSPECITAGQSFVPTFFEEKLSKYGKRYLLEYNFCKEAKKSFILLLQNKKLNSKEKMICRFCGSSLRKQKEVKEIKKEEKKYVRVLEINKTVGYDQMQMLVGLQKNEFFNTSFLEDLNLSDTLYECKQCFSVFNRSGTVLLRSINTFFKLNE